jgi:mono/diheme cytochrome c family protein
MSRSPLGLTPCVVALVLAVTLSLHAEAQQDPKPSNGAKDAAAKTTEAAATVEFFEKRVRPILVEKCHKCHGPAQAKNALRLDSREAALRGGESGPAVVPRDLENSLLIAAVRQTTPLKMPPDGKLSEKQIADLSKWIADGAIWPAADVAVQPMAKAPSRPAASLLPDSGQLQHYLQAWYRADAIELPDGEGVPLWPDASRQGRDLGATRGVRQNGVGTAPRFFKESLLNRRPAVRFGPSDGLATSPARPVAIRGDAEFSLIVVGVLQANDGGSHDAVLGLGNPAAPANPGRPLAALIEIDHAQDHELSLAGGHGHDAVLGKGSCKPLYGRPMILSIVKTAGPMRQTTRFFINGDPSTAPPLSRPVTGSDAVPDIQHRSDIGLYLGKAANWSGGFRGDVGEVLIYGTALNDDQRYALESHLAEKYAITLPRQFRETRATFTAEQKGHWAFQPVKNYMPPERLADESWPQSPIDRFILAKLESRGLHPSSPADRRTLIRRVTFDLTGLPPTPEEIAAFERDTSPDAWAKLVNRLLDSPHYGERWGRHWLDVVRFAESTANDANAVMRYACRYRNYVVDAFNRDLPYDEFVIEQLAGDLLPPTDDMSLTARRTIATGYLMLGPKALAETDKEQSRLDIVDDQIDVTSRAFLGLTVACARCHDHKFDPIPTVDYYALAGIFRSTEPFRDEARNATMWWEFPLFQLPGEKPYMVMAPKEATPRNLRVHVRGNRMTLGMLAPRGFVQVLSTSNEPLTTTQSGRLELARWIASANNPLTARVMVNRVWQHHFGVGLVATSDNFGRRGTTPTHPELLDYLAHYFVQNGWSIKSLHRLMLLSRTYQQQSAASGRGLEADPENRLLWRMPRRRLDAESLRDTMLAVSGKLDRTMGGTESGEILYSKAEVLDDKRGFAPNRMQTSDPHYVQSLRRSIYLPFPRNAVPDVLALFDSADPGGVTPARNETTVPSQALFLLNSPLVRDQAKLFAARLLANAKLPDADRVRQAYELALGRVATPVEVDAALVYLEQYAAALPLRNRPEAERRLAAWQSLAQAILCLNEFVYVD